MVDVMKLPARNGEIWHGDCLELMRDIPSGSVDMILCDLPYGTTQNKWDSVIPFEPLWSEYWRIAKPNAAVVLTAAQPFTSALVMSCPTQFKYDWTWCKNNPGGFAQAKNMPLKQHESILVFSRGSTIHASQSDNRMTYYPQNLVFNPRTVKNKKRDPNAHSAWGNRDNHPQQYIQEFTNYPCSLLNFDVERGLHPTQKPVALFEYLIKTYTNPGDVVMDNCIGSGTTAIAAENTGRRWIGIERDFDYFMKAWQRIMTHDV